MKVLFAAILGLALSACGSKTELQKNNEALKDEIGNKAVKEARKEAKQFEKDGWFVAPGALPMDKQIEKAWMRQYEEDENGYPKYIVGEGNQVAETQSAANLAATELAKLDLAGKVETQVAALIETSIANQQLNAEDAASISKVVAGSKNIIAQQLGRVIVLFKIYRRIDKNVEANVRIAYNSDMAKEAAKKVLRKKLEEETEIIHEKLDKILDF